MKSLVNKMMKKESTGWFFLLTLPLLSWIAGVVLYITGGVALCTGEPLIGIPMAVIGIVLFVGPFISEKRFKRWMGKMVEKGYFSEKKSAMKSFLFAVVAIGMMAFTSCKHVDRDVPYFADKSMIAVERYLATGDTIYFAFVGKVMPRTKKAQNVKAILWISYTKGRRPSLEIGACGKDSLSLVKEMNYITRDEVIRIHPKGSSKSLCVIYSSSTTDNLEAFAKTLPVLVSGDGYQLWNVYGKFCEFLYWDWRNTKADESDDW